MSENLPQNSEPKKEIPLPLRIFMYILVIVFFGLLFFVVSPGFVADEIIINVFLAIVFALIEVFKKKKKI